VLVCLVCISGAVVVMSKAVCIDCMHLARSNSEEAYQVRVITQTWDACWVFLFARHDG
jgi:hypothetical protein